MLEFYLDNVIKSVNRFSWAIPLLAVQQLGNIFSNAEAAIDSSGIQPAREQLPALLRSLITLEALTPRYAVKTGFELLLRAVPALQHIAPTPDSQTAWTEFRNKLQCFYLFAHVDSALNLDPKSGVSLLDLTARAARLDPYLCVFATEGAGHCYTDWCLANKSAQRRLLNDAAHTHLPSRALVPLHAGMGLSLAEAVLSAFEQNTFPDGESLVSRFIQLCQANSQEEYVGATYEAMGLAARSLFPHLIPLLDYSLAQTDERLLAYFWHGVGRAIYFSPVNFLPWGDGTLRGLQMCLQEPLHGLARRNAVAGFAWAMTLVNIRQPEITAQFLRHHERDITESDAFINGICSALIIWHDSAPDSPDLEALARFRLVGPEMAAWNKYVVQSCDKAFNYYQALKLKKSLGTVFSYQNLSNLTGTIAATQGTIQ